MIIYGFYGTGKSTICASHPEFHDFDFHYFMHQYRFSSYGIEAHEVTFAEIETEYAKQVRIKEKEFGNIFINHYCPDLIDLAFIQSTYQDCIDTLDERKQGNFVPTEEEYNETKEMLSSVSTLVVLSKGQFIKDYSHLLERK